MIRIIKHMPHHHKKHVWIITDFKIGDKNLCRGIATKLGFETKEIQIAPPFPWSFLMPFIPYIPPKDHPCHSDSPIAPPFPDIAIASSRLALNYLKLIKKLSPSTTTIFLKDPYVNASSIDLIWRPEHDFIKKSPPRGHNTFCTLTAPHRLQLKNITPQPQQDSPWHHLPKPHIGCLIGDPIRFFPTPTEGCENFKMQIDAFLSTMEGSLIITPSRRTPEIFLNYLKSYLLDHNIPHILIMPHEAYNPYLDILTYCDAFMITGDSHNMLSEALITGKPIYISQSPYEKPKLRYFVQKLFEKQVARPLQSPFQQYTYDPIDQTEDICARILSIYQKNHKDAPPYKKIPL